MSKELIHGRPSTYNNHKCRCEECTAAWAKYIREGGYVRRYQQRRRQKEKTETPKVLVPELRMKVLDLRDEDNQKLFHDLIEKEGEN